MKFESLGCISSRKGSMDGGINNAPASEKRIE